ncbi:MAG: sodium/proline symporter [Spirochaetes bacterium]|nr:sodium/proline symporter [Spirochaetota bacterium]
MENITWVIAALIIYVIAVFAIVTRYRSAKNLQGYLLGDRSLSPWVAAFSAQASDMSSWLLMGLPGAIYAVGTSNAWIAVGLLIGTACNWFLVAKRIRRYTIITNNSITLPGYLENRFRDKSHALKISTAVFFAVFFTVYVASFFVAMGVLISMVFGIEYMTALILGATFVVAYTFIGGFLAVSTLDFFQGSLMLFAIIFVPLVVLAYMGGWTNVADAIPAGYLNMFTGADGSPVSPIAVISGMAWGLGYFGMPHILARYMAIKKERYVHKSGVIAVVWVIFALFFAVLVGIIGIAFIPGLAAPETIFIQMIDRTFLAQGALVAFPLLGGLTIVAIMSAVKSTADSQMLVVSSVISSDIYGDIIRKGKSAGRHLVWVGRFSIVAVALVAFTFATSPGAGIMVLVAIAWAGLGSSFGPIMLLSIYWKRVNVQGALAGIITGGLTVITWVYVPLVSTAAGLVTLNAATGLFALVPGFTLSFIMIIIVTLLTKEPSKEVQADFETSLKPLAED